MSAPAWMTARPIAHRGLHDVSRGILENSVSAAQAAISGHFGIECDVQWTADGDAVVFHDFTLDRLMIGSGPVADVTATDLARVAMKGTMDRIPTLHDFIALIAGRTPLVIEIKSRFDGDLRLARRTAEIVAEFPDYPIVLKSFDPVIVTALATLSPQRARGIVAMNSDGYDEEKQLSQTDKYALANLLHFPQSQPDFLSWRVRDLPTGIPMLWRHGLNRPVMTWTVRSEGDRQRAADHADQIVFEGFVP